STTALPRRWRGCGTCSDSAGKSKVVAVTLRGCRGHFLAVVAGTLPQAWSRNMSLTPPASHILAASHASARGVSGTCFWRTCKAGIGPCSAKKCPRHPGKFRHPRQECDQTQRISFRQAAQRRVVGEKAGCELELRLGCGAKALATQD